MKTNSEYLKLVCLHLQQILLWLEGREDVQVGWVADIRQEHRLGLSLPVHRRGSQEAGKLHVEVVARHQLELLSR